MAFYNPETADLSNEVRFLADYEARQAALIAQRKVLAARSGQTAKLALERLAGLDTLGAPDFQAVVLPEGGKRLLSVAPLLAYFDVDPREVRFLGTASWEDLKPGSEPSLRGGWFTAPSPELWLSFRTRYQETFGAEPPRLASLAYDATALAAVLARRAVEADRVPDYSQSVLTQRAGFAGAKTLSNYAKSNRLTTRQRLELMATCPGGGSSVRSGGNAATRRQQYRDRPA